MDPELTETWELVRKAKGGDSDALDRLLQRYHERVRRSVRARIDRRLREHLDTEDNSLSAFAKAFENFNRFETPREGSFRQWLAEYAQRKIHDAADRENPVEQQAPGGKVSSADEKALEECLEQMSPDHRMVIVLRDYDGLEWREVAQRLGKQTESSVRELHRRALLELATMLRSRGATPAQGVGARSHTESPTPAAVRVQSKTRRRVGAVWLLCLGITAIYGAIRLAFGGFPASQ